MSFNPCAIIPIYNHEATIEKTVSDLHAFNLPCIIVDDGSNQQTQDKLNTIIKKYPDCILHRLHINQGKGAAVKTGLKIANQTAYTHALQVDADGQHDLNDIPAFLETAEKQQNAIICAQPVYDESIPTGRKIARYITHFWVAIETLSLHPIDTMCGFRMYPVKQTNEIISTSYTGNRMDFDIEILVRIYWSTIPIVTLKSKVAYPEDGVSHFNYFKDNILISKMHTRLFFGMLYRSPLLIYRKLTHTRSNINSHWSEIAERGSAAGIQLLFLIYKFLGRRVSSVILAVVVAYFFLTNAKPRKASLRYLHKVYETSNSTLSSPPNLWTSYRHFLSFGLSALDKASSWTGKINHEQVIFPNAQELIKLSQQKKGAVIISAHLGNIELSRALAQSIQEVTMNAVVFTAHAEKFNNIISKINPDAVNHLIHVNNMGPETAIMIKNKIDQGEMIVIMGDRTAIASNNRNCTVDFFAKPAQFSQGPFILASLLNCPVYLMFCLKEKNGFHIYLEQFSESIVTSRKNRTTELQSYVQRYVTRLEYYCKKYPLQWFNFFDIWQQPDDKLQDNKLDDNSSKSFN